MGGVVFLLGENTKGQVKLPKNWSLYSQTTIPVYFVCLNGSVLTTFHISARLMGKCGLYWLCRGLLPHVLFIVMTPMWVSWLGSPHTILKADTHIQNESGQFTFKLVSGFREIIKIINAGQLTDNRCQVMEIAHMDISSR